MKILLFYSSCASIQREAAQYLDAALRKVGFTMNVREYRQWQNGIVKAIINNDKVLEPLLDRTDTACDGDYEKSPGNGFDDAVLTQPGHSLLTAHRRYSVTGQQLAIMSKTELS